MKSNRISISDEAIDLLKPHSEPFEDIDSCIKRIAIKQTFENQKLLDKIQEQEE